MKKVKVIKRFNDMTDCVLRAVGDEFDAADDRAKDLADQGYVIILEAARPRAKAVKRTESDD